MRRVVLVAVLLFGCGRSPLSDTPTNPGTSPPPGTAPIDGDQTIDTSVVLNECHALLRIENERAVVASWNVAPDNRLLLLWQTQDGVAVSGAPGPLDETTLGDAGRYAFHRFASATQVPDGFALALDTAPAPFFDTNVAAGRTAQVCTIPEFGVLTVNGTLAAAPWDGSSGGIAAFAATDVHLAGTIDANGAGFRGGVQNTTGTVSPNIVALDPPETEGGGKGEGADGRSHDSLFGKGNYLNGGGGGNGHNAGGGGGSGAARGGLGGFQQDYAGANATLNPQTQGIAGAPIGVNVSLDQRLVLGGGGGSGHGNGGNSGVGGRGGGVVLIFAAIDGDGVVDARGEHGGELLGLGGNSDGAGGGGGGGTIWITGANNFQGQLDASGGDGGGTGPLYGPGGGGGGGTIVGSAIGDVSGGTAGTDGSDPRGATAGQAGSL